MWIVWVCGLSVILEALELKALELRALKGRKNSDIEYKKNFVEKRTESCQ